MKGTAARADYVIAAAALCLLGVGIIMVYSASNILAAERYGDGSRFFTRQLLYAVVGLLAMLVSSRIDYHHLAKAAPWIYGACLAGLAAVLIPGLGVRAGGATRWLSLSPLSLQPSEFAKLGVVILLATYAASRQKEMAGLKTGLLWPLLLIMVPAGVIMLQPDMGLAVTLAVIGLTLMFVAGTRLRHLALVAAIGLPALALLIVTAGYRVKRLLAFLHPWDDPTGAGFQIVHSYLAFGSGGILGRGVGNGWQKLYYLPEPHTDFIFSVLGEELGFIGVAVVLTLFLVIVIRGVQASMEAPDVLGTYLALGTTLILGVQAFTNVFVVMGLLPTKGMTLPFISYGGSSLVVNFLCLGILLNISRHRPGRPARGS